MASSALLEISERHKNFNENFSTKTLKDVMASTGSNYRTSKRYFKEQMSITSSSTSLGVIHQFRIPRSDGFVGNYWLDATFGGAATTKNHFIYGALEHIEFDFGSEKWRYSGLSLLPFLLTINTDHQTKEYLADLAGDAKTTTSLGQVFAPIIGPGSNGCVQTYGDMGQSPAWPVGKMAQDMYINVKIRAASELETTSSVLTLTSLKIQYDRYRIKQDLGIPKTKAGDIVIYSYHFTYIQDQSFFDAVTATEKSYNLDPVIIDSDVQWIGFFVVIDGEYSTNKDHFNASAIVTCKLDVRGQNVYEQSSLLEKQMRSLKDFKGHHLFPTNSTHFYSLGLSANFAWNPKIFGSSGVNLNLESPLLKITHLGVDTVRAHVWGVSECAYQLKSNRSVVRKLTFGIK
jgi:hypothetical protein